MNSSYAVNQYTGMGKDALEALIEETIHEIGRERCKGFLNQYGKKYGGKVGASVSSQQHFTSVEEAIYSLPSICQSFAASEIHTIEKSGSTIYFTGQWKCDWLNKQEELFAFLSGYTSAYVTALLERPMEIYWKPFAEKSYCYFRAETKIEEKQRHTPVITELKNAYEELTNLYYHLDESETIEKKLISLFFEDKDLLETLTFMAHTLKKSIIIDYRNKIIESAFIKEKDEHIYYNWAEHFSYTEEKQNDIDTFPIRANNINLGRLVVIGNQKLISNEKIVITRALNVLTIQLFHEWKITHSIWKNKQDFFEELLNNPDHDTCVKRSHLFHFSPYLTNRIAAIKMDNRQYLQKIMKYLSNHYQDIDVFLMENHIIVILSGDYAKEKEEMMKSMQQFLLEQIKVKNIYIGVGREANDLKKLVKSYQDACRISDFIQLTDHSNMSYYEDLEAIMMFLKGTDNEELIEFYKNTIGELVEYDRLNNSNFLLTLKAYLDNNGNLQQTADDLHLSITGLRYRLDRIEKLCQAGLKTGASRFKYQLAMRIHYAIKINTDS
ncbi:PucR C-terminal helix-turn-helix domain-containing protein [Alteribacillus persepolensis]|uniref:PucR C-terminal helix-turn-helix domain-containing protein n=1 Tax=Alteribacillus persepolensis TaxID=568899 RepID=A0A1G7Y607_9BACI|nr:PucR family transcriptional regulator [Alteribacillus persepolensis]SDG91797.1 PucR C-terminal helix-turn-helix domain-containing protein [Alteribacillus persepolensis]